MSRAREIYFLTPVEYAVLLAGKGVKRQYTLQADTVKVKEAEVCYAMSHLYQTGLIDSDLDSFHLQADLERLMTSIKEAEYILCVRFGRHEKRDFCCFVGKEVITGLRLSRTDGNSYEIYETDIDEIQEVLVKSLETKQMYMPILEEEEWYQKIRNSRESISKELIRKYNNLLMAIERIDPLSGNVIKRFLVSYRGDGICCDEVWNSSQEASQIQVDGEYIRCVLAQMMESEED